MPGAAIAVASIVIVVVIGSVAERVCARRLLARRFRDRPAEEVRWLVQELKGQFSEHALVAAWTDVATLLMQEPGRLRADDELQTYCVSLFDSAGWYDTLAEGLVDAADGGTLTVDLLPTTRLGSIVTAVAMAQREARGHAMGATQA